MYHKIHPLKAFNVLVFNIFTKLDNHHHHLSPGHFHDLMRILLGDSRSSGSALLFDTLPYKFQMPQPPCTQDLPCLAPWHC